MILQQIQGFLKTPPLWKGTLFEVEQFNFPEDILLDFIPQPISESIRLGHQIEQLFVQLLAYSKKYNVVLSNHSVKRHKITIGEIDYIIQNTEDQSLTHVELTYKFYLIDPTIPEPIHQLIGPNRKDSFYEKLQKIKTKQFQLLHTEEAINELKNNTISVKDITSKACFKAQLFISYALRKLPILPFEKKCIVGYWFKFQDFKNSEFISQSYYLPTKQEWLIAPHLQVRWQSYSEILPEICKKHEQLHSPMVWMKNSQNKLTKIFIVWWS